MLEDLTTSFVPYLQTLRDASVLAVLDSTSEFTFQIDDVRTALGIEDGEDLNTAYAIHLTV